MEIGGCWTAAAQHPPHYPGAGGGVMRTLRQWPVWRAIIWQICKSKVSFRLKGGSKFGRKFYWPKDSEAHCISSSMTLWANFWPISHKLWDLHQPSSQLWWGGELGWLNRADTDLLHGKRPKNNTPGNHLPHWKFARFMIFFFSFLCSCPRWAEWMPVKETAPTILVFEFF